jgi:hypothetical protein
VAQPQYIQPPTVAANIHQQPTNHPVHIPPPPPYNIPPPHNIPPLHLRNLQPQGQRLDVLLKTLRCDGNDSWKAFQQRINRFAEVWHWRPQKSKDYLFRCLEGNAIDYYAGVRVSPFISLICISYLYFETDHSLVS